MSNFKYLDDQFKKFLRNTKNIQVFKPILTVEGRRCNLQTFLPLGVGSYFEAQYVEPITQLQLPIWDLAHSASGNLSQFVPFFRTLNKLGAKLSI